MYQVPIIRPHFDQRLLGFFFIYIIAKHSVWSKNWIVLVMRLVPGVSNCAWSAIKIFVMLLTKFFVRIILRKMVNYWRRRFHTVMVWSSSKPARESILVYELVVSNRMGEISRMQDQRSSFISLVKYFFFLFLSFLINIYWMYVVELLVPCVTILINYIWFFNDFWLKHEFAVFNAELRLS